MIVTNMSRGLYLSNYLCAGFLAAPSSVTPSMALNSGILIVNFFLESANVLTAPLWSVTEKLTTVVMGT